MANPDRTESSNRQEGNKKNEKRSGKKKYTGETPEIDADYLLNMNGNNTFTDVTDKIRIYLAKNCTGANALLNAMKHPLLVDLPALMEPDPPVAGANGYDAIDLFTFQEDKKLFSRQSCEREDNFQKAFNVIRRQCTPELMEKVRANAAWENANADNNPMALLCIIRSCTLGGGNSTARDIIDHETDLFLSITHCQQANKNTSNSDYLTMFTERMSRMFEVYPDFSASPSRVAAIINDEGLDANDDDNFAPDQTKAQKESMAALFVKGSQRRGALVAHLCHEHTNAAMQAARQGTEIARVWPPTIDMANQFASNHRDVKEPQDRTPNAQRDEDGMTYQNEGGDNNRQQDRDRDRGTGGGQGRGAGRGCGGRGGHGGQGRGYDGESDRTHHTNGEDDGDEDTGSGNDSTANVP
mmetsp:Transcript_33963/g.48248  ORF Transcript_33963/g.48248 Transcript_33963/m.48248 type:complete len:412 (-) Transcript_33963:12-1247(-)